MPGAARYHFRIMPTGRTVERALLSATWEIEATYGLQYLSAFLLAEDRPVERAADSFIITENVSVAAPDFSAETKTGSIAHLVLSGAMMLEDGLCSYGIRSLNTKLNAADANPNVSGIVLEINSGGGESIAGTELQNTLLDIQRRGQTKTVIYAQTLASAALRGALGADYIFASSSTATVGSVGTMISLNREVLRKMQETDLDIYARQSTMKNRPGRALMTGDVEPLIDYVSERAQGFIDNVEAMRPRMRRTTEQANRLQSGDLFTGAEAAQIGLIDAVGTFADALRFLQTKNNSTYSAAPVQAAAQPITIMSNATNERSGLVRLLNSIFGIKVAEDATDDQVAEALQPLTEPTEQTESIEDATTATLAALAERVENLAGTVEAQAVTIATLDSTIGERANRIAELEAEVAAAKLGTTTEKTNGTATDRARFNTVVAHDKKFGAKYQ